MRGRRVFLVGVLVFFLLSLGHHASAFKNNEVVGIWLFDEGSGETAEDASGNGHDGTIQGAIAWVEGQFGKALQFPGAAADTWVMIPHDDSLNLKTFTVSAWVKLEDIGNYHCILSKVEPRLVENYAAWSTPEKVVQVRYSTKGNYHRSLGKTVVVDGTWHHIAGTFDLKTFKYYVDGQLDLEFEADEVPDTNPGPLLIGAYPGAGAGQQYPAKGAIDEVGVFSVALNADEIKKIFTKGLEASLAVTASGKLPAIWGNLKNAR